ncbi:MAG: PAS domain S-box protein [Parvularculaceae bacterium]
MDVITEGCRDLCGYEPHELTGNAKLTYGHDVIHPDDQDAVWRTVQDALQQHRPFCTAYRIIAKNGALKWVWEQGRGVFSGNGNLQAIEGFITDITELKETKLELQKLIQAVEQNASAILIADSAGVIDYVNPRYAALTGFSQEQAVGAQLDSLQWLNWKPGELESLISRVGPDRPRREEMKIKTADGRVLYAEATFSRIVAANEGRSYILMMIEDITARKEYERQLIRRESSDDLTGLPNRASATARLMQGIKRAVITQSPLGTVYVSLDGLSRINETLGHHAGDHVLQEAANRLLRAVNVPDTVTRIGYEKFLIISPDLSEERRLEVVARKVLESIRQPFHVHDEQVSTTASLGVCIAPERRRRRP